MISPILSDQESEAARRADAELEARGQGRLGAVLREKYRLDEVLGYGGAATVYAATHRNGTRVALKLLHPELTLDPDVRTRFLREGYVANKVRHPGAVAVIDDDVTAEGWAFLVMELLEGLTAHALWEAWSFRLSPACVTAIVLQLLDVCAAAHANAVVHRDLKPDNLFLMREGDLKVLDFGIARIRQGTGHRTSVGAVLGTPAFMAPEQAGSRPNDVDGQTDLWAVGSIAFALLSGEIVHPSENAGQTLIQAATKPARALGPRVPDVPTALVAVIDRALQFDKSKRWGSAEEMKGALEQAAVLAFGEIPGRSVIVDAMRGLEKVAPPPVVEGSGVFPTPQAPAEASPLVVTAHGVEPFGVAHGVDSRRARTVVLPDRARPAGSDRSALMVAVGVVGAAVVVGAAFALRTVMLPVSGAPTEPPALASASAATASAPAREPVAAAPPPTASTEPEPSTSAATAAPAAPTVSSHPRPSVPGSSAVHRGCTPPYVIDPTTGRKKWKTECL